MTLATPQKDPLQVLCEFFNLAWCHSHGGARVAARLLLSLYNSRRFPFELDELRCLDSSHLADALVLLKFDANLQKEVHDWLNHLFGRSDFGMRFEHLAHKWARKAKWDKCKKEFLHPVEPLELVWKVGGAA